MPANKKRGRPKGSKNKKKSVKGISYKSLRSMVKDECMKEAETKFTSDGLANPNIFDYTDDDFDAAQRDGGYRVINLTPIIEQSGDNKEATRFRRQGDKVRILRCVVRLVVKPHSSDSVAEAYKDYDWRVLLIKVKKGNNLSAAELNTCLLPRRKGALQIDIRNEPAYDKRKQFNVLEEVSFKPKYYKILGTTDTINSYTEDAQGDEIPNYTHERIGTVYGLHSEVKINHDFKAQQWTFENDNNEPIHYDYKLVFQNGWKTVGGSNDPGTQEFPRVAMWHTWYFKDA